MGDVDAPVEHIRTPEDDEEFARRIALFDPLEGGGLEPDKVYNPMTISKMRDETPFAPMPFFLEAEDLTFNLHKRHVGCQLMDIIEACTVDMLVGEIV